MKLKHYYKNKQLVLAHSLFNNEYSDCNQSEKCNINSKIKSLLSKYEVIPFYIADVNFELRKYMLLFINNNLLKNNKLHKDKNSYIWFLKNNYVKEYSYIYGTTFYLSKDVKFQERIFHIINNITNQKHKCENKNCINNTKYMSFSIGYKRFCSIKCSKNPEELKNINYFGGVHKIRQSYDVKTAKEAYQLKCRKLTEQTKKLNMNRINPNNHPIGRMGVKGAYQVDHIISVDYGYNHNIDPEVIANINNLQTIPWLENAKKGK